MVTHNQKMVKEKGKTHPNQVEVKKQVAEEGH